MLRVPPLAIKDLEEIKDQLVLRDLLVYLAQLLDIKDHVRAYKVRRDLKDPLDI